MGTPGPMVEEWHARVPKNIRGPAGLGLALLALSFAGFGVWANTAPISSAVVAHGAFVATGQNKVIQHLEGGIIDAILVEEGERVAVDQPLVRLDPTAARAEHQRLSLKRYRLLAMQARLIAEHQDQAALDFTEEVTVDVPESAIQSILDGQRLEFLARKEQLARHTTVLKQRIAAIKEEIGGLKGQRDAATAQLGFISEELKVQETLLEKGLTKLSTVLALKREQARLEGERGAYIANIGRAKERITETESEILLLKSKRIEEAVEELRKVETELVDVEERLKAARDVLARLDIRSPVKGIVVKLSYHTPGGVISPGQEIMEILPIEEELLVEAYIRPIDIDMVKKGNEAQLRLTALNQRVTPMVTGDVIYVSADTIKGEREGEVFYMARVRIDKGEAKKIAAFEPAPGMPVEVYVETGERTFFEYLLKPLSDSFQRAFRES